VRALSVRAPHGEALARFRELAALLTGSAEATPDDGARYVAELCRELEVPGLAAYGVTSAHLDALVHKAERASSMRGNPLALTTAELRAVAEAAL